MDPGSDQLLHVPVAVGATVGIEMDDAVHADAHAHQIWRQLVEIDESLVPGEEPEIPVKNRDALLGVVDRVLEKIAAVLDRRRRVVEEPQGRLRRDRPSPQKQRQCEPRGSGADSGGEEMLRVSQQMNVGFGAGVESLPATMREPFERTRRPLVTEISSNRCTQLVDGDAGTKQAEARSHRNIAFAHKDVCLNALHRAHRTP